MTIPSTGPLRPRELYVRRDRRPDALLVVSAALTMTAFVLVVLSWRSDDADVLMTAAGMVVTLSLLALIGVLWLIRPRPLPPITHESVMPTVGPSDGGSVSPDKPRGSWPWS